MDMPLSPSAVGMSGGKSERVKSPLLVGEGSRCPPPENFEILDGRRCNLGIYLRKMKLLIGLKNAGFFRVNLCSSQREIEEIQASQNATKLEPTDNAMANTEYTCRC